MRTLALLTLAILSTASAAQSALAAPSGSPRTAVIQDWYFGNSLYVSRLRSAQVVNVQTVNDPSYGEMNGMVSSAGLRIEGEILPFGCNVSFLTSDIVGQVLRDDTWTAVDPVIQVGFGLVKQGVQGGEICPGVPARPFSVTLPLVSGISSASSQDRLVTFMLPGPATRTGRMGHVRIRVLVNQKTHKLAVQK